MRICSRCNTSFEGNFCPNCGAKYHLTINCSKCGSQVSYKEEICPNCGTRLSEHTCSNCKLTFDGEVCPNCGKKYIEEAITLDYGNGKNQHSNVSHPSNKVAKPKKKNIWKLLVILLVIYLGLSTLDALGLFVMGTYYEFTDGEIDQDSAPVVVEFYGKLGGNDGEAGMSYRVHGENMTIYWGNMELMNGKVVNGVMKLSLAGNDVYYCKDGKVPQDIDTRGFMDYFRAILSPASKLISNILYD